MNAGAAASDGSGILNWHEIKDFIALWTGLERDALHIYAALLVQVGTAFLLRRSLGHWAPWAAILLLALLNEAVDMFEDGLVERWEIGAGLHDLWNTMLLPSLLLLLARFAPSILVPPPPAPIDPPTAA